MAEKSIQVFGSGSISFDPSNGPIVAIVEVDGGSQSYWLDLERERVRLDTIDALRDLDRWLSPGGLILSARLKLFGLNLRLDRLPDPHNAGRRCRRRPRWNTAVSLFDLEAEPIDLVDPRDSDLEAFGDPRRAYFPRDVVSCPRCRDLVIARRDRSTGRPILASPTQRLYRRYRHLLERNVGKLPKCVGRSDLRFIHGVNCPSFDLWLKPFAASIAEARAVEVASAEEPEPIFPPQSKPRRRS